MVPFFSLSTQKRKQEKMHLPTIWGEKKKNETHPRRKRGEKEEETSKW